MSEQPAEYCAEQTLEIPESAFVSCPLQQYAAVRVTHCAGCEYYQGVFDTNPAKRPGVPFERAYKIRCAWPIARDIIKVIQ